MFHWVNYNITAYSGSPTGATHVTFEYLVLI